ncbi:hypothetical protein L195_g057040 [Trifolium pratense]|uniref:Uncharacterized protein n=2 Tax=Trifolium pratense TaxID=57577 RepID=A0A2K3KUR0_TRIPR|nr:hypothetical protein L195_g057040 [Trifolium pratense]
MISELENDLLDLKSKQENYFKNMEEARLTAEQLDKTNKVLEDLKVSSVEERRKLEEEIFELKAKVAPVADETEDTLKFTSRAELVGEIRRLGGQMVASMGIHKLKKVEKGQIVIPEKYREMALEEEKQDDDDEEDEDEDGEEEEVEEEKGPDGDKEGHDESS